MHTHVWVKRAWLRRGRFPRQKIAFQSEGLISLYNTDIRSDSDFVCAPAMNSFSVEQVRTIVSELQQGRAKGKLGDDLFWSILETHQATFAQVTMIGD